jgi:DNA polymerase-3 subunit beta
MKFIINREDILIPLQQIVSVIEKRQTMPILANVLLNIENNELTLTGTDLEIQIINKFPITSSTDGMITVPARKFLDICRLLPAEVDINFKLIDDKLKITSGRSRFSLSTLSAQDYPKFSESEMDCRFDINSGQLREAFDKTLFCMANQDVRYYLNGLMLNIANNKLKFVASDGHRLAIYEAEIEQQTGIEAAILIPRKGIIEMNRLLDNPDVNVNIQFSKNHIVIYINNLVCFAKLIDAKYPDYSKVFNQDFFNQIYIEKQLMKDALARVAILSNEKLKGVAFDFDANQLVISTHNPEHEEADETLPIDYSGEPISIAFNAQYIMDAVTNLDSDQVVMTVAGDSSGCFIQEPGVQNYKFVVMPMRL